MENPYWKLVSAQSLQKKFPGRYLRPNNRALLRDLKKGNFVQLIGKRSQSQPKSILVKFLRLEIIGRASGLYYGRLVDQSIAAEELNKERLFAFRPEHVLSVEVVEKELTKKARAVKLMAS